MSVYVIYYDGGAKKMRPVLSEAQYRALRDDTKNRELVALVRGGEMELKRKLLQMNYSCVPDPLPPTRGTLPHNGEAQQPQQSQGLVMDGYLKGCKTPSNSVGMDIDFNVEDPDYDQKMATVPELILSKKDELGLLMLERSATKGYHMVFRRHEEMSQEQNLQWASQLLGVAFDSGAKDITRVFFTTTASTDDLLYLDPQLFEQKAARDGDDAARRRTVGNGGATQGEMAEDGGATQGEMAEGQRGSAAPLTYLGIKYAKIIKKWWEFYNDGHEPVKSNRNTLTFELAVNLRHICGFDREVLDKVIPCYDGFSEQEKLACIDSALAEKRTQMPKRLKDVLTAIRSEGLGMRNGQSGVGNDDFGSALDNALQADELYHYEQLPKLPQGVSDSVDAAGHSLAMPTLVAIAPAIGALATGVKLDVHGKARGLNLCSFVVGEFASGKGQMDDIIAAWMAELQAEADIYTQQEEEWAAKTKRMKSGKAPEQPKLPVRMLTLNNTVANIAERLSNTQGKHSFSFTPEADNVALKWKQSVSDFSVMLRQAYDEARYDREAKSADAVRVHIKKLLWNVTMCGTQDALYRVITNYTDGMLSRMSIASTPDNTYMPLADNPAQLTDLQEERIKQIAHILSLMTGTVSLPKLELRGREWLEKIRLEAIKNDDRVLARQRFRGCVNAMRVTVAIWLPKVAETLIKKYGMNGAEVRLRKEPDMWVEMLRKQQTEEMLQLFDIIADYLIDNDLFYFRDRIAQAYESKNYQGNADAVRSRKGKNFSIYERLGDEFTFEQALQQSIAVKGSDVSRNSIHQMLKNWKKQGLIEILSEGRYRKIQN